MKVIIVRHAQTDENVGGGGLAVRTSEVLLNSEGILQAQKLGEHLKGEKISYAYASPQKRAVHTAEHILRHHPHITMRYVEDLREQDKKGGESRVQLQARSTKFFHELSQQHPNDTVLVVSHGGTLGVLLLHILEKELTEENYRAHQPKNTEYTMVEIFDDGKKKIHSLNSRQHLDG